MLGLANDERQENMGRIQMVDFSSSGFLLSRTTAAAHGAPTASTRGEAAARIESAAW